jgi:hypothetical protein
MHLPSPVIPYSDTKNGPLEGGNFKEYICEELACYSTGMTGSMKRNFKCVNIVGNAFHNVTSTCIEEDYNLNCAVAM